MAQITPDTFDPLRRFVSVRLQQGVPIVDADWNEMDDVRRFEMRAHSHWFVGSGVPYGSEAFRIDAVAVPATTSSEPNSVMDTLLTVPSAATESMPAPKPRRSVFSTSTDANRCQLIM